MRRGGLGWRAGGVAVASLALVLGGALVAAVPAHAAVYPGVDSEAELNAAIGYAVANPGDPVQIEITGDFSISSGMTDIAAGSVTIHGNGHTISGASVPAFFAYGPSSLAIDDLALDFTDVTAAVLAIGDTGSPATSPTVTLSGVDIAVDAASEGVVITDAAFTANGLTIAGGLDGIVIDASFGETFLTDVTSTGADDCGITAALSSDAVLTATRLGVTGAGCTGLSVVALDNGAATISDSVFADNGGAVELINLGTGVIRLTGSTMTGSTSEPQLWATSGGDIQVSNSTISGGLDTGLPPVALTPMAGTLAIEHTTITGNAVSAGIPVIEVCGCGTGVTTIEHTIVGGNPGASDTTPDLVADVSTVVNRSLIEHVDPTDTTTLDAIAAGSGNLYDAAAPIAPDLGTLALNGGTTPNHLPNPTSPVINAGDPAFVPPPATDQRGSARISGGIVDIGSVELQFNSTLALSRTTSATGDHVTATGTGFPAGTTFSMVFNSTPVTLGTATSSATGGLSFAFTVPASASAGAHTVTATLAGNVVASAAIEVTGLPDTGTDPEPAVLAGLLLFLLGAAALTLTRRRPDDRRVPR